MKIYIHKINPNNNPYTEKELYKILIKNKHLGTGFSVLAKYTRDDIKNYDENKIKEKLKHVYPDWNFNKITIDNVNNFINMNIGDIVIIPLTKFFNNNVLICKIISNEIIIYSEDNSIDIGYIREVQIIKKYNFIDVPQKLKDIINSNKRKNSTIKIDLNYKDLKIL